MIEVLSYYLEKALYVSKNVPKKSKKKVYRNLLNSFKGSLKIEFYYFKKHFNKNRIRYCIGRPFLLIGTKICPDIFTENYAKFDRDKLIAAFDLEGPSLRGHLDKIEKYLARCNDETLYN